MKFYDFLTGALIALIIILIGLPELIEIRAIVIQDFAIVWFMLYTFIFLAIWFYFINKAKNNLKRQILIIIAGMAIFGGILFLICTL
ncbi:hypothetical protein IJ732_00120 [bacterium]|nr:hypothetical protein [bacterium]